MKKLILAFSILALVSTASATSYSERQIKLADPVSFTSPSGDAPGFRFYHMLQARNGYHWEAPEMTTNRWVYFDAHFDKAKTVDRAGFNIRVESENNIIRLAYVYAYLNGRYVAGKRVYVRAGQCPEIFPKLNDEGGTSLCGNPGIVGNAGEAYFGEGIKADKIRFYFIGNYGVPFTPQITDVNFHRSESNK